MSDDRGYNLDAEVLPSEKFHTIWFSSESAGSGSATSFI